MLWKTHQLMYCEPSDEMKIIVLRGELIVDFSADRSCRVDTESWTFGLRYVVKFMSLDSRSVFRIISTNSVVQKAFKTATWPLQKQNFVKKSKNPAQNCERSKTSNLENSGFLPTCLLLQSCWPQNIIPFYVRSTFHLCIIQVSKSYEV